MEESTNGGRSFRGYSTGDLAVSTVYVVHHRCCGCVVARPVRYTNLARAWM